MTFGHVLVLLKNLLEQQKSVVDYFDGQRKMLSRLEGVERPDAEKLMERDERAIFGGAGSLEKLQPRGFDVGSHSFSGREGSRLPVVHALGEGREEESGRRRLAHPCRTSCGVPTGAD